MSAMPHERTHLRAVQCTGCEKLALQTEEQAQVIHEQDVDLRKKRRELSAAKRELAKFFREHPKHDAVDRLFAYWQKELKHPGAKLDPARTKAILLMLEFFSPSELAAAVKGCAVAGTTNPKTGKLYDSIGLIFRDADHVDEYIGRYAKWYHDKHGKPPSIKPLEVKA